MLPYRVGIEDKVAVGQKIPDHTCSGCNDLGSVDPKESVALGNFGRKGGQNQKNQAVDEQPPQRKGQKQQKLPESPSAPVGKGPAFVQDITVQVGNGKGNRIAEQKGYAALNSESDQKKIKNCEIDQGVYRPDDPETNDFQNTFLFETTLNPSATLRTSPILNGSGSRASGFPQIAEIIDTVSQRYRILMYPTRKTGNSGHACFRKVTFTMPIWKRLKDFLSDRNGATAVEYAVVLALIVLASIVTILILEGKSKIVFNVVGNTIGTFGTIGNGT